MINNNSRTSKSLSPTTKRILSQLSAEHLDGFSEQHERDIKKQREWAVEHFGRIVTEDISEQQLLEALEEAGLVPVRSGEWIQRTDLESLGTFKENLCLEDGRWVSKRGKDWMDFVKKRQDEREEYRVSSGNIRRRSDPPFKTTKEVGKDGKEVQRKYYHYKEPLLSTFIRMPPWLAVELNAESDEQKVKEVITRFAEHFAAMTGHDVLAVNIHRETEHDFHIHIFQSDVIKAVKVVSVPVKERKAELKILRDEARAQMKEKGLGTHPAQVKNYMQENGFAPTKTREVTEFRKIIDFERGGNEKREDNWPVARRDMHVLGTAYRHKGWLYTVADAKDKKTVAMFREQERKGNFYDQFTSRKSPETDFVDWWAETELYDRILGVLPKDRQTKVRANAKAAVSKYLKYGKSVLHPAEIALADEKKEFEEKSAAVSLVWKEVELKKGELEKLGKELAGKLEGLVARGKAVAGRESVLKSGEAALASDKKDLGARETALNAKEKSLSKSRDKAAKTIRSARSKVDDKALLKVACLVGIKKKKDESIKDFKLRISKNFKTQSLKFKKLRDTGAAARAVTAKDIKKVPKGSILDLIEMLFALLGMKLPGSNTQDKGDDPKR